MVMRASRVLVCVAAALLFACGGHYVTRGADLYASGYYVEAAEVFARTEDRLESSNASERARYGLYRGATLLALGDARRAERWLRYSKGVLHTEGGALSAEERVMLGRALRVLSQRRPSGPAHHDEPEVATSQTPPASEGTLGSPAARTPEPTN